MNHRGPIVLVGGALDEHVAAVAAALRALAVEATVLDSQRFPEETRLSLGNSLEAVHLGGTPLPLPAAVYLRGLYGTPISFDVDQVSFARPIVMEGTSDAAGTRYSANEDVLRLPSSS